MSRRIEVEDRTGMPSVGAAAARILSAVDANVASVDSEFDRGYFSVDLVAPHNLDRVVGSEQLAAYERAHHVIDREFNAHLKRTWARVRGHLSAETPDIAGPTPEQYQALVGVVVDLQSRMVRVEGTLDRGLHGATEETVRAVVATIRTVEAEYKVQDAMSMLPHFSTRPTLASRLVAVAENLRTAFGSQELVLEWDDDRLVISADTYKTIDDGEKAYTEVMRSWWFGIFEVEDRTTLTLRYR